MAKYQLLLPKMGESVAEATIIKWNKKPGDYIEADEAVMEIATDKVDSEVPSPVSGKLIEQLFKEDEVVQVGSVIAIIETEGDDEPQPGPASTTPAPEVKTEPSAPISEPVEIPGISQLEQVSNAPATGGAKYENRFYSPLVKNIATQEGIGNNELDQIPGSGAEGRLTKDDLLAYLQKKDPEQTFATPQPDTQPEIKQQVVLNGLLYLFQVETRSLKWTVCAG